MIAPIAIFAFNRPKHLLSTLESLSSNPEFKDSPLYFFCDGSRSGKDDENVKNTRQIAHLFEHTNKYVIESESNKGLSRSITEGVSHVLAEHGKIIVVEDDLFVSKWFLGFMNSALNLYAKDDRVMQVSGHMFDIQAKDPSGTVFLPFTTSWGWATWSRAWDHMTEDKHGALKNLRSRSWRFSFDMDGAYPNSKMLNNRIVNKNSSWAVWFYYNVHVRSGVVLFPQHSLVNNEGFDGSGTHCRNTNIEKAKFQDLPVRHFPADVVVDLALCRATKLAIAKQRGLLRLVADNVWRIFGKEAKP